MSEAGEVRHRDPVYDHGSDPVFAPARGHVSDLACDGYDYVPVPDPTCARAPNQGEDRACDPACDPVRVPGEDRACEPMSDPVHVPVSNSECASASDLEQQLACAAAREAAHDLRAWGFASAEAEGPNLVLRSGGGKTAWRVTNRITYQPGVRAQVHELLAGMIAEGLLSPPPRESRP